MKESLLCLAHQGPCKACRPQFHISGESTVRVPAAIVPALAPPCVGRGVMGNSGLSNHFRVVRALVWAAVGGTAGQQGLGDVSGGTRSGPGQSVSAKWNPEGPIFKAICRAKLCLCLHLRTPHLPPQPGKNVCSQGHHRGLEKQQEWTRQLLLTEPLRNWLPGPSPALCWSWLLLGW